jgi:hypothetical protein
MTINTRNSSEDRGASGWDIVTVSTRYQDEDRGASYWNMVTIITVYCLEEVIAKRVGYDGGQYKGLLWRVDK